MIKTVFGMSRKDISNLQVCQAMKDSRKTMFTPWPYELLAARTGECEKVCYRAMERAEEHDLIDYGTSLRTGWLTEKGVELINAKE